MTFAADAISVFLGVATLLALSIYTIVTCRAQIRRRTSSNQVFLFEGLSRRYSLAGTMGAAFSLTYYGATTIYGHIYRGWFLIFLVLAFSASLLIIRHIISLAHQALAKPLLTSSNLLLEFLRHRIGNTNFRYVVLVYSLIYFGLLVEELAISRLVLSLTFPNHPVVTAVLLATMCLVILVYLTWGGFKALLIADFEQLKLLLPFLLAICLLAYRGLGDAPQRPILEMRTRVNVLTLPLSLLLFVAWIVSAVDFYSRLNFRVRLSEVVKQHQSFATVSLVLLFIVFFSGGVLGALLPESISPVQTPSALTKNGIEYAMAEGSRVTLVVFFASLFCMIFTTVNTILFTLLQVGYFQQRSPFTPGQLSRILLFAVLLSCAVPPDAMSCIGMFIGSLMLIPFSVMVSQFGDSLRRLFPRRHVFLSWTVLLATVVFAILYRELEHYSRHFWLSAIVLGSLIVCGAVANLVELLPRSR